MRRLLLSIAAAVIVMASPFAQGEGPADETRTTLRDEFLRLINRDRQANGLAPVQLDPEASAVADAYCREQIRNRTTGHFTVDGLSPYMRYSLAGGNDGLTENAAAWSATYTFSEHALADMLRRSEQAMLRELPPHDGHRKAILDPFATHVGIGLAWEGGEFRLTQEFVRRYVDWKRPLVRTAVEGEKVAGSARPADGYRIEAISVHFEPVPRALPAFFANSLSSYSLPENRHDYLPRLKAYRERRADGALYEIHQEYADGSRGDFAVADDGTFTFDVPFTEGAGIYTVVVWLSGANAQAPISVSNVSIRVEAPRYGTSFSATR